MFTTILSRSQAKDHDATAIVSLEMTPVEFENLRRLVQSMRKPMYAAVETTGVMFGFDSDAHNAAADAANVHEALFDTLDRLHYELDATLIGTD